MENPIKMDDLRVPLFLETSIYVICIDEFLTLIPFCMEDLGSKNPYFWVDTHLSRRVLVKLVDTKLFLASRFAPNHTQATRKSVHGFFVSLYILSFLSIRVGMLETYIYIIISLKYHNSQKNKTVIGFLHPLSRS